SFALRALAEIAWEEGDAAAAHGLYAEALAVQRASGIRQGEITTLRSRGSVLAQQDREDEAIADLRAARAILREVPVPVEELLAIAWLARLRAVDAAAALA